MKATINLTFALLLLACTQAMATFSGGDDFNDNVRDVSLWSVYQESAERQLIEQNGRLEAISTAGVYTNDTGVWEWIGQEAAYDENWTVTFDATITVDEATVSEGAWLGFGVLDPTGSYAAGSELWIDDVDGGRRGVDAFVNTNGVDLDEVNYFTSSQTVTLRISYDSGKKELHASYDDGGGYWNYLASQTVTNWGMDDTNHFCIRVFGGSDSDSLASGEAYGDNFKFEVNKIESDPEAVIPCQSIVGGWYIKNKQIPSHDNVAITFLTNGIYFMCQDGDPATNPEGAVGYDGMEMGTYSWNPVTGELTNSVLEDTNAEWGFSDQPMSGEVFKVVNNEIYVGDLDVDPFILTRVVAQTSPASLVGSWVVGNDEVVITFLDNGIYYLAHAGNFNNANPDEGPGMERGIYTWDSDTGAFSVMATVDTTVGYGLDTGTPTPGETIIVNGNTAHFTVPGDGEFDMHRVIVPDCSDIDTDGLPDAWEQQFFGNPTNAVPNGNSDGDDLTDREEFIAGTLPNDNTSFFAVSNAVPSQSGFVLNWHAVEGRVYSVLWADSLTNSFQMLTNGIAYPQNSYTDTVHAAESGGFYNLKVELGN